MKLLLTGATGFVGRTILLKVLQEKKYSEVWVPVRSESKLRQQLKEEGMEVIPSELKVISAEAPHWKWDGIKEVDHLVHCAGILFADEREVYFSTHVEGTRNLFRQVQFQKAVVLSSQAATGPCGPNENCKDEKGSVQPITWYGESKLEMERLLQNEFADRNYVVLRPPMVLGPRDSATLPLFKMVKSPVFFKSGLGLKYYSFVDVGDLVEAIFTALASPSGKQKEYFVGSLEPIADETLIRAVALASSRRGVLLRVPQLIIRGVSFLVDQVPAWRKAVPSLTRDRAKEIWPERWVISSLAFQRDYSWKPKAELSTTLKNTFDWYFKTGQI